MWSKVGRFVEGLHVVGDILKSISVNGVIKLYAALLSTCLFYGFIICGVITVCRFLGISCICCMSMVTIISM
jgi:hypothetical protein